VPELHPGEVFDQAQVLHNEMVVEVDDPVLGRVQQVAPPAKFALTPSDVPHPAPVAGPCALPTFRRSRLTIAERGTEALDRGAPLDGLRILDFGAYYAGPYSSRLLADLGADVIKLEPTSGDQLRGLARPFRSVQAGKRSIAANLKDPGLDDARRALLAWADVVHHNLRPGAAERLGLGYDDASAINPEVVYVYAPGWGSSGPDMYRQSFAPLMSGFVGVGFEVGGEFNPPMFPLGNEDPGNGLLGAAATLMALLHRQQTGRGQYVENPQLNATMTHVEHIVRTASGEVLGAGRVDLLQRGIDPLDRLFETSDGWLVVVAPSDTDARRLANALGVPFTDDERFATWRARREHEYELGVLLDATFATRPKSEWLPILRDAGIAAAEPLPPQNATFLRDPEHQRSGRAAQVPDAQDGQVREVGTLYRVSDADLPPHRLAPELGADTGEILRSVGYSRTRINELRTRGAIR
jgi:crotonobetainyl-CoA:carnitine CoA-transferase CaiB-like acyl-CoA transferase